MATIVIEGSPKKLSKTYVLPKSKSISNRLQVLHFLYGTPLEKEDISGARDSLILQKYLSRPLSNSIDTHDAGTVMRYMTAVACTEYQETLLYGTDRMHQRPISGLVSALQRAGASIEYKEEEGFPPVLVRPSYLSGSSWSVDASISSQFVSAMIMLMPQMKHDMHLKLVGSIVSKPYIEMTLKMMQIFDYDISFYGDTITLKHQSDISPSPYHCASDYSALAFPILELATNEGEIQVRQLSKPDGMQGDEQVLKFLPYLGIQDIWEDDTLILRKKEDAIETDRTLPLFDFKDIPDLALPIVVALCLYHEEIRISGTETLNLKESERWEILQDILYTMGFKIFTEDKHHTIRKVQDPMPILNIPDGNDHRVVMTMASVSAFFKKTYIEHPDSVIKSYPEYWQQFNK